jgi:glyoxylase-like metal-dependent hydrolase (beta-lactamase superfamily II)
MLRKILIGLGVLVLVVLAVVGWGYWRVGHIGVQKLTDNLYMMEGLGGNVGVLITDEGVAVVDTMTFAMQGDAILARIAEITDKPVVAVINTHYHMDHTHGNPAFAPGTKVVSTARTLEHLKTIDADYWRESPARELLPNETFDDVREITVGGKQVRLFHPGRGHTDGDLVAEFVSERVIHVGDLCFNGRWPRIDLVGGGSVRLWDETLGRVLGRDFDRVIPGHGPVTDRAGLTKCQEFIRSLWSQTKAVVDRGGSLEQARQEVDLSSFQLSTIWYASSLNREFVIGTAYEEASGKKVEQ